MERRNSGKLRVTLPSDKELLLTREFDAPRELVFAALTTPELVRRWWASMPETEMTVCEIDLRVGGRYRFVLNAASCGEVAFHGEYREIAVPARLVHTEVFEPYEDSPALVTVTLEERGERTLYEALVLHTTKEARDMHIQSGMEEGAGIAFDQLEAVARELAAPSVKASNARAR
jgi:uncharacterized protein YndB with AHSA1/START domain